MLEEDEDLQVELRGVACRNLRENVEDMYLQTYLLLKATYKELGTTKMQQLLAKQISTDNVL